jgi:Domain of unknown function (DUF4276)
VTTRVHLVLLAEGQSDEGLLPHLEVLCVEAGADEVTSSAPDFARLKHPVGPSVEERLRTAMLLERDANIFFIHRDADNRDSQPRYQEISRAAQAVGLQPPHVPLVPVQETEAWLLLDETAIRAVASNPRGTQNLNLPKPAQVERVADPKTRLKTALCQASGLHGRRLHRFKRDFSIHRRLLLQLLPTTGPIEIVPAWQRLRADIAAAIQRLFPGI